MSKRLAFVGILLLLAACGVYYLVSRPTTPAPVEVVPSVAPVHTVIGRSVDGRAIDAYTYGTGATHMLFVGGMHGGYEWNTVVLAYQIKDYLDAHPEIVPDALTVTLIPSLNPDGVYKVTSREGSITTTDIPSDIDTAPGRFNANDVDLNRNFDCNWQPQATWRTKQISAGANAFSEPESQALHDVVLREKPVAVVFWHSQSGNVYAADCSGVMAPHELDVLHVYASAAGYKEVKTFDAYPVTGDSEGWLASIGIPAITVELTTHTDTEFDKNLKGVRALLEQYRGQ